MFQITYPCCAGSTYYVYSFDTSDVVIKRVYVEGEACHAQVRRYTSSMCGFKVL